MLERRGYHQLEGLAPNGDGKQTFHVPTTKITHLQRYGPKSHFYDSLLLKTALQEPIRVLIGLEREDFGDAFCYVSKPNKRYRSHDIELPPPPKQLFLVFVRKDFVILDWEWRFTEDNDPTYPKDWKNDFDREIWPCS